MLDQVISVLNLDMEPAELSGMITTENPENTRILTISVESAVPEEAQAIANAVREAASVTIQDIMEIDAAIPSRKQTCRNLRPLRLRCGIQ